MQTASPEEFSQPEATAVNQRSKPLRRRDAGHGDSPDVSGVVPSTSKVHPQSAPSPAEPTQCLKQRVDYIRQNIMALKTNRGNRKSLQTVVSDGAAGQQQPHQQHQQQQSLPAPVPASSPSTKAGGAASKGAKNQRDSEEPSPKSDCPRGHVMLPEKERKETLRILLESYKSKVQEMNALPVRSDTLRMQRRKMELEDELKKIDEGIKIFQRAQVYVKVNV